MARNYRRNTYRRRLPRGGKRWQFNRRLMVRKRPVKTGLPNKMVMKMRYSDLISLDPVAGGFALHVFRATSLFDPDFTSTGHQYMQYDQIGVLYDHSTIIWSKITVAGNGSDNDTGTLLVSLQDDSGTLTTMNQYMESRNRVFRLTNNIGNGPVTIQKSYSPKKFLGISHPLSEKDLSHTIATNPAENAFFHVVYAGNTSAEFSAVGLCITLEAMVVFTEPITVASS